ncbi:MAG: hypothetical protein ACFFD4_10340 [Candidatus Odinarchaeota archaeon]
MGKMRKVEDIEESVFEQKFWYILFRVTIGIGTVVGIINVFINAFGVFTGKLDLPDSGILLFLPYSFIGGFALGALILLWLLVVALGVYEIIWFTNKLANTVKKGDAV